MISVLDDDERAIVDVISRFSQGELKPAASEIDETACFVDRHFPRFIELGLFGPNLPIEYGGSALSGVALYCLIEELAAGCMSTTSAITAHYMATDAILIGGSEALKKRFLPRAASGEILGGYAMTEPRGGSNPADMRVKAELVDGAYRLNGVKHFISNGGEADFVVVFCKTDAAAEKPSRGVSALVVERGTPGFVPGKIEPTMGLRGGHIWELAFEDCLVPAENVIGPAGTGFKTAMIGLDYARLDVAAMCTGLARAALDDAVSWSRQRLVDGHPIAAFQGIQWMLADMATELEAARLLGLQAAVIRSRGERFTREVAMAKLFSSEMVGKVTDLALQIHGGYGYSREMPLERYVRDARITRIFDGSSEVHRNMISKQILAA